MEVNTDRVIDLMTCRTLEDLRQLYEEVTPSSSFLNLARKHNRADLLKFLFEEDTSPDDGADIVDDPRWRSVEQEDKIRDAVHGAIRTSNVDLLRTLIGTVSPQLSERLLSESYEELLLNNVLLSEEMNLCVQYKLHNLRFFCKGDGEPPVISSANIQERIQMLVENVAQINTYTEVDSHFIYTAKFISQNIYILKQQLKSTYNILPWEEMEFCLVSFVSAHVRRQELNIFYLSVLKKDRLLKELNKFAFALQSLKEHIGSTDVQRLKNPVRKKREDVAAIINSSYPDLYADYKEVRDISSLHIMKTYLEAALLADSATRLGQLTIKRALQVTGEHLKNTLDSPKLSPDVSKLLLLSVPKETKKVLQDLRNTLSHPHLELEDSILYSNIQNDLKKIASVIIHMTYFNKVGKIKRMLATFINSESVDEIIEIANVVRNISIVNVQKTDMVTKYHRKIEDILRNVEDQSPYEKKIFADIKNVLDKTKIQHHLTDFDYSFLKLIVYLPSKLVGQSKKNARYMIISAKNSAKRFFESFAPAEKEHLDLERCDLLSSLISKFYKSVSMRIRPDIAIEIKLVLARISFTQSIDRGNVNFIDEYSRKLLLGGFGKNDKVEEMYKRKTAQNSSETIDKQLTRQLTELETIIGTNRIHKHISLPYKDETTNRFTVEALMLDILSLLDNSKCVLNNVLYLDGKLPLLSGKYLRNHLAHNNALVDILSTDAWSAVLLNAVKLTESKNLLLNRKIGNISKHDVKQMKQKYQRGLSILDKQKEMFKSLLDGNIENFTSGIVRGADILSRKEDLSSTLHYAARGPNVESIKFLIKQKMISTKVRDVDGQTALHVAATYGRDVTVKILATEMGNAINQVDYNGDTPLHLASQNGHKKTVLTLLSLGAKTTVKDFGGNPPLYSAVKYNNLDVVKILLNKEVIEEEIIFSGGFTCLNLAAEFGHLEMVRYLLLNGADVNARTDQGTHPLHIAALNGHLEVVHTLLAKGAHVNLKEFLGRTPLHFAVENNHEEIVKILLEKGAFVNNGDVTYNDTPFHVALFNGNAIIVGLLLHHNANVNARRDEDLTPLLIAAKCGHTDIVDLLLQKGALVDSKDVNGLNALHIAAKLGHSSTVRTLIQWGFDIHTQTKQQDTPLHLAVRECHEQVVNILLSAGANLHSVNNYGLTALHLSGGNGHEAISKALIKKGAKLNSRDSNCMTPLHVTATQPDNEKTIKILLKYGADVKEKAESGRTALHFASFAGDGSMLEALLQGKSDVDAECEDGATALHMAVQMNHSAAVEILLKYGANINHLDKTGSSILCQAAKRNNKDLLDILISQGADVNVGGGQPLFSAITAGHRLVFETLLKNKKIDINIKNQDGSNILYTAAKGGDGQIAKELIKRGVKVEDCTPSPLLIAIYFGHTELVDVLLENGANVNPTDPTLSPLFQAVEMNKPDILERLLNWGANSNVRDLRNKTPLELAVGHAQIQNTSMLLQQVGDRINERNIDNLTLLHIAAIAGNLEIIKLLVDRGADINALALNGFKPIHLAAINGHHNILAFFLELGMCIDDLGPLGLTLLHSAAGKGQLTTAQYLIDKQVDINSTNFNGYLPIHYSTMFGQMDMAKLLLHSGAMYDAMNKFGKTPSDLSESRDIKEMLEAIGKLFKAVKRNDILMVGILIKDLAKYVNAKSSDNATLLHIASWRGFQEICDILLKNKANPNAVGKGGNGPLHYASKYSHPGIVENLLKNGAAYNLKADNMKTPLDFAEQKDVKYLLTTIAHCFRKVKFGDVKVIEDIAKLRNVEIRKAVMKARDTDGNTLVVVAMKNAFPNTDELKQVALGNITFSLFKVERMFMCERFTEALDILKRLLIERIEILGEDNPGTLDIEYKIAQALSGQCKYLESMSMLEDIYKKRVEKFGPHHPDSLKTRSSVGLLLHRLGKNKEAWDIFQEVVPRQQETLGEGHEDLMKSKTNLGDVLVALGMYEEALDLNMQMYEIHKKILGTLHPNTLRLKNNIAMGLHVQGKHCEALALFQTVYESRKNILGQNHSETLRTRYNMASVLMKQKKIEEALQACQETLAIQKNVLGLNHVDTVRTQSLMTRLYFCQINLHDALKVHKAEFQARSVNLGHKHPNFSQMDELFEVLDKFTKTIGDEDVGYIPSCDFELLKAASRGDRDEICNLIENGSDVNTVDDEGRTALHFATTAEVMKLLLDSGADATAVSQKGNTPLHLSTSRGCGQTVRLLLQNVKSTKPKAFRKFINAKTIVEGSTALHVAANKGITDIVGCLLTHGAYYNSRDRSYNRTPLQCSCSPSVTRLLRLAEKVFEMAMRGGIVLPQGDERYLAVVMNSRDTENRTPLQVALVHGHNTTARLLDGLLKSHDYRSSNGRHSIDALD